MSSAPNTIISIYEATVYKHAYTPKRTEDKESIHPSSGQASSMGIQSKVGIVDGRQKTPATIDLRVVLVNFRYYQKDRCQK